MRGLALLRDERGAQTVSWVGLTAAMTALLLVMYSVLNGNAMLRGAVTNATSRLAIEFGQDITFGAPRMARPPGAILGGAERGTAIEFGATAGGATEYGATAGSATEYGATAGSATEYGATAGSATAGSAASGSAVQGDARPGQAANGQAANGQAVNGQAANGQAANGQAVNGQATAGNAIVLNGAGGYTIFEGTNGVQQRVRPARGVAVAAAGATQIRLEDRARGLIAELNPSSGQASLIDPATSVATPVDLDALQQLGLVTIERTPVPAAAPLAGWYEPLLSIIRLVEGA